LDAAAAEDRNGQTEKILCIKKLRRNTFTRKSTVEAQNPVTHNTC